MNTNVREAPHSAVMSIDDTARYLGVGRGLTYREIKCGKLTAKKLGRRTVVLREDADDYLRNLPQLHSAA